MVALLIFGCYSDFDYEYMSLAQSMEITEYGQTELHGVRDDTDMPIRYVLERDEYVLYAVVDTKSISPSAIFNIEGKSLIDANIKGESIRCIAFFHSVNAAEVSRREYPEDGIRFSWKPNKIPPCDSVETPTGSDRKVVISVYDGTGRFVTKEEILFEIKANGIRRENNSI